MMDPLLCYRILRGEMQEGEIQDGYTFKISVDCYKPGSCSRSFYSFNVGNPCSKNRSSKIYSY